MILLRDELESVIEKFGPPAKAEVVDEKGVASLSPLLPSDLVGFFAKYGVGMWLKGKFQFCRSDLYDRVCQSVLNGDVEFRPEESAIFGFTAFGEVFIWNREHKALVQVKLARQIATTNPYTRTSQHPELAITDVLRFIDKNFTDLREDTPEAPLLFARAVKKLGELELGQVYGFAPALALGGSATIDRLFKMNALEHLAFLAQLRPARLMNYKDGREEFIRVLGPSS